MKITIGRDLLYEALQNVNSVVPQKPTLPVLSNFLIRAENSKLSISGTDMDMYITTDIQCEVVEEGSITINAKRFLGVVRELPSESINIEVIGEYLNIIFSQGDAKILGMSSSDYPSLRDTLEGVDVSVSGDEFIEMVNKTSFSVATDRTRLALTGVYWKVERDRMAMVATDGHRLSLFEKTLDAEIFTDDLKEIEAIVPPKALSQAARVVTSGIALEKVIFGKGAILFDFITTKIFSKLIEGPYPNFRQVIPTSNSKKVFIAAEQLASAVRRVSVLSNSVTHQIRMSLNSGQMEITTLNQDIGGEARENLTVRYEGEPVIVAYNASFLMEIFRVIDTDEIVLELETPMAACIIRPVAASETRECLYLIMPLRLNE